MKSFFNEKTKMKIFGMATNDKDPFNCKTRGSLSKLVFFLPLFKKYMPII